MKKTFLFLSLIAITAVMPSCEKAAGLFFKPFESPLNFAVSINPVAAGVESTLGSSVVNYNLDAEIKKATSNEFGADFITQMYVNQIAIALSNSDGTNNLSNFESVSLSVSTGSGTPVVLGPFAIPSGTVSGHTITVANSPNIRQFFNGANVTFALIGKTKTATTKVLQAQIGATIKFDK